MTVSTRASSRETKHQKGLRRVASFKYAQRHDLDSLQDKVDKLRDKLKKADQGIKAEAKEIATVNSKLEAFMEAIEARKLAVELVLKSSAVRIKRLHEAAINLKDLEDEGTEMQSNFLADCS